MAVADDKSIDYYEVLQVSPNADPDTIHRIYRLMAQRFHPDNQETGDDTRFRAIHEAYTILSDPQKRAGYDVHFAPFRYRKGSKTQILYTTPRD